MGRHIELLKENPKKGLSQYSETILYLKQKLICCMSMEVLDHASCLCRFIVGSTNPRRQHSRSTETEKTVSEKEHALDATS